VIQCRVQRRLVSFREIRAREVGPARRRRPHSPTQEARRRSSSKLIVIVRDPEHRLLGPFVAHLLGQDAGFFGSLAPMLWVVEMRAMGMERALAQKWPVATLFLRAMKEEAALPPGRRPQVVIMSVPPERH